MNERQENGKKRRPESKGASRNFRDLKVWQKGMEIVRQTYRASAGFPQKEQYGLTSQMQRAAVSVPANVAEGFNRYHNKDYRQFLYVALGSCAELETHVEIATELKYLDDAKKGVLLEMLDHESRMLTSLISKLA
ncbi:MAG TPA: four helix bundle protein [Sedimentisphaerales bacterium]|nr:four helix bundle protein [Sedimentisphaerales bacterium]HRS09822.1 four helix bundle protein [Sedimentisphaerales bacterium]HRV46528.1 four helix bundle protein [Sedimentisphaerales bacterium]